MTTHNQPAIAWRKSSHSNGQGACVEVAFLGDWRKSSHSNGQANCVEVAFIDDATVAVRDSKAGGHGPVMRFTPAAWTTFLTNATEGEFDIR